VYVDAGEHWHHFDRFAEAVKELDPPAEAFRPRDLRQGNLRMWGLMGNKTLLVWCRDTSSDWRSELLEGKPPAPVRNARVRITAADVDQADGTPVDLYDPWANRWTHSVLAKGTVTLPEFTRSIVLRVRWPHGPPPLPDQL
jgi:hypothetical protein